MAILYFPQSATDYSGEAYLVAHYGFFLCNLFNLCYIFLFEWLIFQRRTQISAIAFSACFLQLLSCITSIHRYNIEHPTSKYGSTGVLLAALAFIPWNIVAYYVGLHWNYKKYLKYAWLFFSLGSIITICLTYRNWSTDDDDHHQVFFYFRVWLGVSMLWQLGCYVSGYLAHKKGRTNIHPTFLSKQAMDRAFKACIAIQICYIACLLSGIPVLQYPGTGIGFINMVWIMVFVGKMDYMRKGIGGRRDFEVPEMMYCDSVADHTERLEEPSTTFFTLNIPARDIGDDLRNTEPTDEDLKDKDGSGGSTSRGGTVEDSNSGANTEDPQKKAEIEDYESRFMRSFADFVKASNTRPRSSFTQKAKFEEEVIEDALVTFTLQPEKWRVAAYLIFWAMAGVAYIITETTVKDYLQAGPEDENTCGPFARRDEILGVIPGHGFELETQSHFVGIFGYNNLCVFWDYSPSREITALIYPFVEYSLMMYVLLDFVASTLAYKRGELTEWFYTLLKIVTPVAAITPAFFRMVFVALAYENIQLHTAGFLSLQICLYIISLHNAVFIWMTKTSYEFLGGLKQTRLVAAVYLVVVVTVSLVKIGSTMHIVATGIPPAFARKYVNGNDGGLVSGQLLDYIWMFLNAIIPLSISAIRCMNEFPLVIVVGQDAVYFDPDYNDTQRLVELMSRTKHESEKWLRKEQEDSFKMNTIRRISELRKDGISDEEIVEWFPDAAPFLHKQPSPTGKNTNAEICQKVDLGDCDPEGTPTMKEPDEYAVHEI